MLNSFIFDLDGTLADTREELVTAMNSTLASLDCPARRYDELISFVGNGTLEYLRRSLPPDRRDSQTIAQGGEIFAKEYSSLLENSRAVLFEGIDECVKNLSQNGFSLAVLSNKPHEFALKIVNKLFPEKPFSYICGYDESGKHHPPFKHKPDPSSLLYIISLLNSTPSNAVLIGDSSVDIKTAKAAGVTSVGVAWGFESVGLLEKLQADYIVYYAREIPDIFVK